MIEPTDRDLQQILWLAHRAGIYPGPEREQWIKAGLEIIGAAREEGRQEERARVCQHIIDVSRETLPGDDAHALCFELVEGIWPAPGGQNESVAKPEHDDG